MPTALVHRLSARGPDDTAPLEQAIAAGAIRPEGIVAILGKTEGNGCVNDFTRAFAVSALRQALARHLAPEAVARVSLVMSGGTEGGLAPHWLVLERRDGGDGRSPALAIGSMHTADLPAEGLGRRAQVEMVAAGVKAAMADAGIDDPADVHFVQIKCPLLTAERIAAAEAGGRTVATRDTLKSMGLSRGASALGVALALGEIAPERIDDAAVGRDFSLWSGRASTSAGVELLNHEIVVLGMSRQWAGALGVAHAVMADALDVEPVRAALTSLGLGIRWTIAKARAGATCRGARQGGGWIERADQGLSAHHARRFRYFLDPPRPRLCRRGAWRSRRPRRNLRLGRGRAPRSRWRRSRRRHRRTHGGCRPMSAVEADAIASSRAIGLETVGMTKTFGSLHALEDVSIKVRPGTLHGLLGENGAGKSTLVKCIMGFYQPTRGQVMVDGREAAIHNPRDAHEHGIGMVYQHFTLVPSLTAAENLVISRAHPPAIIDWRKEKKALEEFLDRMPFKVPLDVAVQSLSAGEKQKLEILKQLYLDQKFLILDEPTSVLTPGEADEVLGLLKGMTAAGDLTILMITHKFREVSAFCDDVSVLRHGRLTGTGKVGAMSIDEMSRMMIGDTKLRERAARTEFTDQPVVLELAGLFAENDQGLPAVEAVNLKVHAGEIVGVAGVSGNGQPELIEVLSGQREPTSGRIFIHDKPFEPTRDHMDAFKVFGLPEEPLKNAAVPRMTVAENIAFRTFDKPPITALGWWMSPGPMRKRARELIATYRVKTPSTEEPIENLSGGNVQRAVLARELSGDVDVLIVANPCFGLDFASVAEIRSQILDQRNRGAAVLLVSEDLDEILELADRVAVMSGGRIDYVVPRAEADRNSIGKAMAGH